MNNNNTSNIEKIKQQLQLQVQVKEIISKEYIDLQDPFHFYVIRQILEKPKKQRTENDLILLQMAFQSIKFFAEMYKTTSQEDMLMLYRELSFIQFPARRTLFHLGDIGKNFYIILSGSVWVLVAKSGLGDGVFITKQNSKTPKKLDTIEEGMFADEYEFQEYDDDRMLSYKYPNLMKVGLIGPEGSFGEIALTNFIPRQATIVCKEDTQFITLTREAFNKFLSNYYNHIQEKNFQFLKEVNIFNHWPETELSQIQYHLQPIEHPMNSTIYKEGDHINGVYFIVEGQIEISERFHIEYTGKTIGKRVQRSSSTKTMQLKLSRLGPSQLFGYLEIIQGLDLRDSKAICLTERVKLLFLAADRFKLYCTDEITQGKLNQLVQNSNAKKNKTKEIYMENENQSQHSSSIVVDQTASLDYADPVKIRKPKSTKSKNSNSNVKDLLANITHQSSKIQSYQLFLQNNYKMEPLGNQLCFEKPLIEIQLSHKAKALMQPKQDVVIHEKQLNARLSLIQKLKLPKIYKESKNVNEDVQIQKQFCKILVILQIQIMLSKKFALLSEFCQSSFQNCFQFLQSDPIEQSSQLEYSKHYETANKEEPRQMNIKKNMIGKMTEEDIENAQNNNIVEEKNNPFEELKPQLNFKTNIVKKQDIEKVPLRYQEEDIDTVDAKWHDDDDDIVL